jgi:perosamine synthetase
MTNVTPISDTTVTEKVVEAIRQVCTDKDKFYPLHEPSFSGNEKEYVDDCIETGWVSSVGKYVDTFEQKLAEFTGAKRAIAVASGTAALHVCLIVAGVQPNDEVLCPDLTFIATANAISYCYAIPHFVDSAFNTLGIDPVKLDEYLSQIAIRKGDQLINKNTGRCIRALVVMHTFGHPVDLDPIVEICNRYGITLVEDAAESLGSYYKGVHTGNFGLVASLSFNGNKTITTGGGGAIITNNEALGKYIKHITTTAKVPHKWEFYHDVVGFNYRMPNLNAALGCAQLENLNLYLELKSRLASKYAELFSKVDGVEFVQDPPFGKSNHWLNAFMLNEETAHLRNDILEATNSAGMMTRPCWILMHRLPMYANAPRMDLDVAESIEARLINIPSSEYLGK